MLKLSNFIKKVPMLVAAPKRKIWGYVAVAFNTVDPYRLEEVGPDRLCAEWILKNGGKIGFVGGSGRLLSDYNSLPPDSIKIKVQIVDASKASIMKIGLEHFRDCRHIDTVIFDECKYLEIDGLEGLSHLSNTLKKLQISRCDNMEEQSFEILGVLHKLQHLRIYRLLYIKDLDKVVSKLKTKLPNCEIDTKPGPLI